MGPPIADMLTAIAAARVPVTTLLIGELGSGGALAFAAPDRTWATPDSYLAVISPELATAIPKRDPSQAQATADQLRLRPQDMVELGIARGIAGLVPRNPDGPTQAHDPGLSRPAPAARHSTDAGKS